MDLLEERLNDRLEQLVQRSGRQGSQTQGPLRPVPVTSHAPHIEELVALARRLQRAPQAQAAPDFARQLERRLLRRSAELRLQGKQHRPWLALLRARPLLHAALGLCLFVCVLSATVLVLAARVSDPGNPLYTVRLWEQHVQGQFSGSLADQATLDLQAAREQLDALARLADAAHVGAYRQALRELDLHLNAVATALNGLPTGLPRDHLAGDLADLKVDAVRVLRGLLSRLALPERLATTDELGNLGDTVPLLVDAWVLLPAHPGGQATVSLQGSDLQAGARLLVNDEVVDASGTLQHGQVVFVLVWKGEQRPQSLGILNPDGTATRTAVVTVTGATTGNPDGKGNQPTSTPTPHGNKPPVTPTPRGNQPTSTPTANH